MSRYLNYTFPAANEDDVCLLQTTTGAGNLILNGLLANPINSQVSYLERGYSRQLSLTSANNLAGRTFTITGIQNGVSITEDIAGPNNNTILSTLIYDVVTSVSVDGAAADISIGSGSDGFFLIAINKERDVINYALTIANPDTTIETTLYNTLDNIAGNNVTFLQLVAQDPGQSNLFEIKAAGAEDLYPLPSLDAVLCSYLLLYVNGAAATLGHTLNIIFLQT
jgi:hypothetical protein